jgi:hypothetical protein
MAYQKLQVGVAASVITSNTIPIPVPNSSNISGQATSTTSNKLVDSAGPFTADDLKRGAIVVNVTDQTIATVTEVDSATTLSLSADIMASGENYIVYLNPEMNRSEGCVLYCGTTGNIKVETVGGSEVTYVGVPAGVFLPVQVYKVFTTGTTATDLIANW